jgi:serine/threonine protein kinase
MESKPLDVLLQLLEHSNEVVGKGNLLDTVWADVETTEQSLTTAIAKLRKAFGGARDSIILNVAGIGYRIAVPVICTVEDRPRTVPFHLEPDDAIPRRPHWRAIRKLSSNDLSPVWLARHAKTGEERVYKFANDGIRLRALQREVTIFRLLTGRLGEQASFVVPIIDWDFEETPFFLESVFCGTNLLEWSSTESFIAMSLEERVRIAAYLSDAVASTHELAIFHNDLKPTNILLAHARRDADSAAGRSTHLNQPDWVIRIADFGVASLQNPAALRELNISDFGSFEQNEEGSSLIGTAMYRPPELHPGDAPTASADVYALGVLLYQLVSGNFYEPPAPGWEQKIADPLLREDIADAANVDPSLRIATVAQLAQRLRTLEQRREEKQRQEQAEQELKRTQQALERTRLLRPWVVFAMLSLSFALLIALWAIFHITRDRNAARQQNATLESMYNFLAIDLLGQSNPYLGIAGSGTAPQQTLVDAIEIAIPQIDRRFAHQAEVAGRLHETIADSLKSRTRFNKADQEYAVAAQRFRLAEGPLSANAIRIELKREVAQVSSILPGSIQAANRGFEQQESLISGLHHRSAELQAWETLVKTMLIGMGPHPEQALPLLDAAVQRAETTPGFDPTLLVRLKNQYCGTYVRLGDGVNLERVSREIIALLTRQHSAESATLFPYQMYLEEAFYLQGRYADVIAQADRNFVRFDQVLGREHQLTLATLATRAAAEGQLERYKDAVRDDLTLYNAEGSLPSGARIKEGSLADAATYECRGGDLRSGLQHARQVIAETGPGKISQPMFYNGSMFTTAECLLSQAEANPHASNTALLDEAAALLNKVDVRTMAETTDQDAYVGSHYVALARLDLLRGDLAAAKQHAATAIPFFNRPNIDPYEKRELELVQAALAHHAA